MSQILKIHRAKPNPLGKDRSRQGGPKPEQLVREWVDILNEGTEAVPFGRMQLHHTKFGNSCSEVLGTDCYWKGNGDSQALAPGQVLRVHTGKKIDEHFLVGEDLGDVAWRAFAGCGNFVLNNDCGDTISVLWQNDRSQWLRDSATYNPRPPEGVILHRVGDRLVPAPRFAFN